MDPQGCDPLYLISRLGRVGMTFTVVEWPLGDIRCQGVQLSAIKESSPQRWLRHLTVSHAYTVRLPNEFGEEKRSTIDL